MATWAHTHNFLALIPPILPRTLDVFLLSYLQCSRAFNALVSTTSQAMYRGSEMEVDKLCDVYQPCESAVIPI